MKVGSISGIEPDLALSFLSFWKVGYLFMTPQEIKTLIEAGIDGCEAIIKGDDGVHFEAVVISDEFAGLSLVKKHQLIYKALGDKMKAEIHALSMKPYSREEWDKNSGLRVL